MIILKQHERRRVQFNTVGESLTHQAMKDECDVNNIMAKWERTGVLEHRNQYQGEYGDFTGVVDYQEAANAVIEANEMFMTVPAKIRARFGNDPAAFLDFVSDPENSDEMVKLGLATASKIDPEVIEKTKSAKPKVENKEEETPPKGE